MKRVRIFTSGIPTVGELEKELKRTRHRHWFRNIWHLVLFLLAAAVLAVVVAAVFFLPARRMQDNSMLPTLPEGSISLTIRDSEPGRGDVVAFQGAGRVQIRRMIADEGDWVDIDRNGNVFVNNELQEEPYVRDKTLGECDIAFPYQVSENSIFVLGDHRSAAVDSRQEEMGCVPKDKILGKLVLIVWPLTKIGLAS